MIPFIIFIFLFFIIGIPLCNIISDVFGVVYGMWFDRIILISWFLATVLFDMEPWVVTTSFLCLLAQLSIYNPWHMSTLIDMENREKKKKEIEG